jgi:hypothetical protein
LTEEDIERLVIMLDQPELLEPLLSLRSKAMREATRTGFMDPRLSSGGSSSDGGSYVKLPEQETAPPPQQATQEEEGNAAGTEAQEQRLGKGPAGGAWREAISNSVRQWRGEPGAKGVQQEQQQQQQVPAAPDGLEVHGSVS